MNRLTDSTRKFICHSLGSVQVRETEALMLAIFPLRNVFRPTLPRNSRGASMYLLARGSVLAEGDYAAVSSNPVVIEAYMGSEAAELAGAH